MINYFKGLVRLILPTFIWRYLAHYRRLYTHTIVQKSNVNDGFAVFGDREPISRFSRIYLNDDNLKCRVSLGLHRKEWTKSATKLVNHYGLMVASKLEIPQLLADTIIRIPRFVALSVYLKENEEAFYKSLPKSARSDISRTKREGFAVEIHRDIHWVSVFCTHFHQVSIIQRHGTEGFVMNEHEIMDILTNKNGEFVCVTLNGNRVVAVLCQPHSDTYILGRMGWLNADRTWVKRGAVAAMYWYGMQRARQLGFSKVSFGGTPPYLEDGVFQFKMKWNPVLDFEDTKFGTYDILLNPAHPMVFEMLKQKSLIALDEYNRFIVYSAKHPDEIRVAQSILNGIEQWNLLIDGKWQQISV